VGKYKGRAIDKSITNRIPEIEERITGPEDSIEIINKLSKIMENGKSPKHIGNSGQNEKIKPKDNRYRRE